METLLEVPEDLTTAAAADWESIREKLECLVRICQDSGKRANVSADDFKNLARILEALLDKRSFQWDVWIEAFRFLRNSVAACRRNQDVIREETSLFKVTVSFLQEHQRLEGTKNDAEGDSEEKLLLAVRCALQFLANSMVENGNNCDAIFAMLSETGSLELLLSRYPDDEKVLQYLATVIHLTLKQSSSKLSIEPRLLPTLLRNLHLEFVIFAMESLVQQENFVFRAYDEIDPESRIKLISFLNERSDLWANLDKNIIILLKQNFIERSDFILRSKIDDRDDAFCWEIAVLLEFLCSLSATGAESLKSDSVLLTTVLCLLRQTHEAGKNKNEENVFAPVDDLKKLTSTSSIQTDEDDMRAHPTFQFKAHLIRLIANMVHMDKANQDKVRELECLPIILDNCKIDARNPFIAQWSVLAIRNLCEGNAENQTYIRKVQRIDTEKLLPNIDLIDLS